MKNRKLFNYNLTYTIEEHLFTPQLNEKQYFWVLLKPKNAKRHVLVVQKQFLAANKFLKLTLQHGTNTGKKTTQCTTSTSHYFSFL